MRHEVLSHIVFNLMHVQAVVESIIHILLFFHDADPVTMELFSTDQFTLLLTSQNSSLNSTAAQKLGLG